MPKKILFVVNVDWFFISHRLLLATEALQRGYEVVLHQDFYLYTKESSLSLGLDFYLFNKDSKPLLCEG